MIYETKQRQLHLHFPIWTSFDLSQTCDIHNYPTLNRKIWDQMKDKLSFSISFSNSKSFSNNPRPPNPPQLINSTGIKQNALSSITIIKVIITTLIMIIIILLMMIYKICNHITNKKCSNKSNWVLFERRETFRKLLLSCIVMFYWSVSSRFAVDFKTQVFIAKFLQFVYCQNCWTRMSWNVLSIQPTW